MSHGLAYRALACGAVLLALPACAPERARAVKTAPAAETAGEEKDYKAMLDQARTRKTGEAVISEIAAGLNRFRTERGRLPTNLVELVQTGVMPKIPPAPAGLAYAYEPRSGNIRMVPVDEMGNIQIPEDRYEAPTLLKPNER